MTEHWQKLVEWLPANDDPNRPRITLSTAGPDARTLLMSEFDEHGFYFHTDSRSRKVEQIAADPRVALTFLWPDFTKQLVVLGTAELAPLDEQARAYAARSAYLKQLAWLNDHENAQRAVDERRERWATFTDDPDSLQPPDTWIGFLVRPHRLTFWEGDPLAASRRTEFTLIDGDWEKHYLPG